MADDCRHPRQNTNRIETAVRSDTENGPDRLVGIDSAAHILPTARTAQDRATARETFQGETYLGQGVPPIRAGCAAVPADLTLDRGATRLGTSYSTGHT
jgi:hypothetical protein